MSDNNPWKATLTFPCSNISYYVLVKGAEESVTILFTPFSLNDIQLVALTCTDCVCYEGNVQSDNIKRHFYLRSLERI